jgi:hypothetical protein
MSRITSDEAHGFSPTHICNDRDGSSGGAPLAINVGQLTADAKFQTLSRPDVHLWNRNFKDRIGLRVGSTVVRPPNSRWRDSFNTNNASLTINHRKLWNHKNCPGEAGINLPG